MALPYLYGMIDRSISPNAQGTEKSLEGGLRPTPPKNFIAPTKRKFPSCVQKGIIGE
jgi:hypothetical protein